MAANWTPIEQELGLQPIEVTETVQKHRLGKEVRAVNINGGYEGVFKYLKGVVNTIVGSLVVYDTLNGSTTLSPNTANLNQPVAVAMSANVALQFGWYQIEGPAVIKKVAVAVAPNVPVFLSLTAGRVTSVASAGKQIVPGRSVNTSTVASGVSTITVLIQRPFAQGQIT